MSTIGIPPRPAGQFDVPLADVEAQSQAAQVLREEIAHEVALHDDREVSALAGSLYLVTHPAVAVSTDDDYPAWRVWLDAQIAKNKQQRRTT